MADDSELRPYLDALARPSSPHLDDDAWERFAAGEMSLWERERALDHVTRCAACARICKGLLIVEREARGFDRGVPERGLSIPARLSGSRGWLLGGLAAVAASLAGVSLTTFPGGAPGRSEQAFRSELRAERPAPVAPLGRLSSAPTELRWRPFPSAAGYRIELFDADGNNVWSSPRLELTSVAWPSSVTPRTGRYYWQVIALMGRSSADDVSSSLVDFELVP